MLRNDDQESSPFSALPLLLHSCVGRGLGRHGHSARELRRHGDPHPSDRGRPADDARGSYLGEGSADDAAVERPGDHQACLAGADRARLERPVASTTGPRSRFCLEWQDNTKNDRLTPGTFRDGVAIGLPLGDAPAFFCMGQLDHYINIWHWKADWQSDIDRRAAEDTDKAAGGRTDLRSDPAPRVLGGRPDRRRLQHADDEGEAGAGAGQGDLEGRGLACGDAPALGAEEQDNEAKLIPGRVQTVPSPSGTGRTKSGTVKKRWRPGFSLSSIRLRKSRISWCDERETHRAGDRAFARRRPWGNIARVSCTALRGPFVGEGLLVVLRSGGYSCVSAGQPASRTDGERVRPTVDDGGRGGQAWGRLRRDRRRRGRRYPERIETERPQGVAVFEVIGNSRADYAGIKVRSVIKEIDKTGSQKHDRFREAIKRADERM